MTTKLSEPLRREIEIDGEPYTVLLTQEGVRLTRKRFREGPFISWRAFRDRAGSDNSSTGEPASRGTLPPP